MSNRPKNSPIGEVTCSHKGCDQVCKVYRFRPRSEGRKTVFSNKHYAECPVHGRIGSDGNPAVTDYILTEGKIWGPNEGAAAPEKRAEKSAPARAPAHKTPEQGGRKVPASTPAPKAQLRTPAPESASKRRWWDPVI